MATRDKDGNYVNDKGVTIKVSEYDKGVKIDFYDKSPREPDHKSVHTHIDYDGTYKTEDNVNGSNEKSSGSCFLTTACMRHYLDQFDDNCYELTILRWFRDMFVSKEDIKHYYETAPIIVDSISKMLDTDKIYSDIYINVISVCIKAIENGNYDFAYETYKKCILNLEEEYVRTILEQRLVKSLKFRVKSI